MSLIVLVVLISYATESGLEFAFFENFNSKNYTFYNFSNLGSAIAATAFALESTPAIINSTPIPLIAIVRRTMKKRSDMKKMTLLVFFVVCNLLYIQGTLVYLSQGDSAVTETAFLKYSWN